MGNTVESTWKENVSADAMRKRCLDAEGESLSVDTENEHFIPDTESTYENKVATNVNSTLDTDDLDIADTLTRAKVDRENQDYSVMQFWQSGLQAREPDFEPLMWLWFEGRSRRISRRSQNKAYERMRAEIGSSRVYPIL